MTFIFTLFSFAIAASYTSNAGGDWNWTDDKTKNTDLVLEKAKNLAFTGWTADVWNHIYSATHSNVVNHEANMALVEGLIKVRKVDDADKDYSWTALIWTASLCDYVASKALVDAGADVNKTGPGLGRYANIQYTPHEWYGWYCRDWESTKWNALLQPEARFV